MKKLAKKIVARLLWAQVNLLLKLNQIKIVAVAGSIGKTSTKFALESVLSQKYKVRMQEGNYNDIVTVPLVFFGQTQPSLFNPFAWLKVFIKNQMQINSKYEYDVVLLEIGTDGPGQIAEFGKYLNTDITVLTAITPEHMEYFEDLDAVAKEELGIAEFAKKLIVNKDLCGEYLQNLSTDILTYSVKGDADVVLRDLQYEQDGYNFKIYKQNKELLNTKHELISETQLYSVLAAFTVGLEMGMNPEEIELGIRNIKSVNGRMQRLHGVNDSVIIDDTYNSSPVAAKAALDTLYKISAPQKIAVLGNMNELGKYSPELHKEVGKYCDPNKLNLLITIGKDANEYLAVEAETAGCKVAKFSSPYDAGDYLKDKIQKGALILVKGSQNGVFAEETVKLLLADKNDISHLVRQTKNWMDKKQQQFGRQL